MNLSDYRLSQNLSVADAASQLNVTSTCYRYWENGTKIPSRENMEDIYAWSNGVVTPNDFYDLPDLPLSAAPASVRLFNSHKPQVNNSVKQILEEISA